MMHATDIMIISTSKKYVSIQLGGWNAFYLVFM